MFKRRGVVIHPHELSDAWIEALQRLKLNVLGLHPVGGPGAASSLADMLALHQDPAFRDLLNRVRDAGIAVEYEMHALSYLLPRTLFAEHPDWFRMDEKGVRTPDFNLCASSAPALEFLTRRTAELARILPSETHRYFFWLDDVTNAGCHCPKCRSLSPSDQQLICLHAMLRGIRTVDPKASLAYIAYLDTLQPPQQVSPEPGIFLEYAPIRRRLDTPLSDPDCPENLREAAPLPALLACFGLENAQVLDYWLDNSLLSGWKYPPKLFAMHGDVVRADAAWYQSLGFESVTTFACYLGEDYVALHGRPNLDEYGQALIQPRSLRG